jgi:hypothetical protein
MVNGEKSFDSTILFSVYVPTSHPFQRFLKHYKNILKTFDTTCVIDSPPCMSWHYVAIWARHSSLSPMPPGLQPWNSTSPPTRGLHVITNINVWKNSTFSKFLKNDYFQENTLSRPSTLRVGLYENNKFPTHVSTHVAQVLQIGALIPIYDVLHARVPQKFAFLGKL